MSETLTVVAHIRAKLGKVDEVRAGLLSLIEPTRADAGCITYDLHRAQDDPELFFFYEIWVSREAWQKHLQMPYVQALQQKAEELLDGPLQVTLWEHLI